MENKIKEWKERWDNFDVKFVPELFELAEENEQLKECILRLENENHKLFNQCAELVGTIYEHVEEGSALMELAEKIDND